jgi:alpha-D-xyloside xylohydrolase
MEEAADKDSQYKEKRVCNLTRSAYTGQQRYGTIMWSGDTDASWGTLKNQVAIGLHFSASGIPFWTNDIGAFFVKHGINWYWDGKYDDTADNKGYCELYTRWYQYSAFLPMFRAHGTDLRRELWTFKGEFYDAMLKANRLRYRLMPYIYSESGKVWLKDASLIRWLAFDFAGDKNTWDITDQFMFGESIMVCPVLNPMYYDEQGKSMDENNNDGDIKRVAAGDLSSDEKSRTVYLPAGCDWFDFYTGEKYEGGKTINASAPLDTIPLFVKDGSVIPMRAAALSTEEQNDEIEFKRFGNVTKGYEFYEDAGDGYGYEKGEYKVTIIE